MTGRLFVASMISVCIAALCARQQAIADPVNSNNITTFVDGQPALAGQVNASFVELMTQINDHAARLDKLQTDDRDFVTITTTVDCDSEGSTALQTAIDNARGGTGFVTVSASGLCDGVLVASQNLLLLGEDLTLRGQSGGSALTVNSSNVVVISLQVAPVTFDANGGVRAIWIDSGSSLGLDNTSTFGATQEHIAVTDSRIYFNGGNVIGGNNIGTGLYMENSEARVFPNGLDALLEINTGATGVELYNSSFLMSSPLSTLSTPQGAQQTRVEIINASGNLLSDNSSMVLGSAEIGSTSENSIFSIVDGSSLRVDGTLFTTSRPNRYTNLLLERNASAYFNLRDTTVDSHRLVHRGSLSVRQNSVIEVRGRSGLTFKPEIADSKSGNATPNGNNMFAVDGGLISLEHAKITANQISVAGGQLTLETGVSFESTQPSTFVSFNGMIVDGTPVITTATCSTGGVAYRLTCNVCN